MSSDYSHSSDDSLLSTYDSLEELEEDILCTEFALLTFNWTCTRKKSNQFKILTHAVNKLSKRIELYTKENPSSTASRQKHHDEVVIKTCRLAKALYQQHDDKWSTRSGTLEFFEAHEYVLTLINKWKVAFAIPISVPQAAHSAILLAVTVPSSVVIFK